MSIGDSKSLGRRFLEDAFPRGNFADVLAPEYCDHSAPPGIPPGPEGIRQLTEPYRIAFPDLHFIIEDEIVESDKIVIRYTFTGTQTGPLMGIPPTGKQIRMSGISIYRIEGGRLQEAWVEYDSLGMMQQLGVVPQPGGMEA